MHFRLWHGGAAGTLVVRCSCHGSEKVPRGGWRLRNRVVIIVAARRLSRHCVLGAREDPDALKPPRLLLLPLLLGKRRLEVLHGVSRFLHAGAAHAEAKRRGFTGVGLPNLALPMDPQLLLHLPQEVEALTPGFALRSHHAVHQSAVLVDQEIVRKALRPESIPPVLRRAPRQALERQQLVPRRTLMASVLCHHFAPPIAAHLEHAGVRIRSRRHRVHVFASPRAVRPPARHAGLQAAESSTYTDYLTQWLADQVKPYVPVVG
mmetsp:Transcript_2659/g.6653  ORF Transcript_2659/g.6653 Transcript_2659/m.6653 type:complete len:263 (+) Transcript_2659:238-1026(+)